MSKTREIIEMGLMMALVIVATMAIKIPTFGGYIHLGDSMIFLSVLMLGRKKGTVVSAVGMAMADLLLGYAIWAPFTFVIKGLMAFTVGTFIEKLNFSKNINIILSFIAGGLVMVVLYFFAGAIIAGLITETTGLMAGFAIAIKDVIGNIIQATGGIAIAIPLGAIVTKLNKKEKYV